MRKNPRLPIIPIILLLAGSTLFASDAEAPTSDLTEMSLEDLMKIEVETVTGASKYQQKVTEAPASITIVTSDEIQKHGCRTLADILRSVRGLFVTYDRNYQYLGLRAFGRYEDYNSRFLLLVDGHRMNDNVYESALIGTDSPVDVDLIERVEVIRGPSSSVYGSNAIFGVINVITKRGRDLKGAETSADWGSFGTAKGRVTYGNRFKSGLEVLLSGSLFGSHGPERLYFKEYDNPASNNGFADSMDDDHFKQLFLNLSYHDFTLQGLYGSREKGVPTGAWGTVLDDPRNRTWDTRGYLDLTYNHEFHNDWVVMGRLSADLYNFDAGYVSDYSTTDTPFIVLNKDYARGRWWSGEFNAAKPLLNRHKLIVGSEFRRNFRQNQRNYDEDPFIVYLDDRRSSNVGAVYAEDEITLNSKLILNIGVRHDHYTIFGGSTNPRLGLVYTPRQGTTLKFLYGSAFRIPTSYELFFGGDGYQANPLLRPETMRSSEVVFDRRLGKRFNLTASGFRYKVGHLITERPNPVDGALQFLNGKGVTAEGIETELAGKWLHGMEGRVSYSFQKAHNQETGQTLVNSPEHLAQGDFVIPIVRNKLFAGMDLLYMSSRKTFIGSDSSGYFLPNFTLFSRRFLKGFEVSASVYNFTNTKYGDPGSTELLENVIYQDGRSFRLKVTYRFGREK